MGTRYLSYDYRDFVSDWLKEDNEKSLLIKLLNFCEGNIVKNKNIIERISNVLEDMNEEKKKVCGGYARMNVYRSLLADMDNYIRDWQIQEDVEFNMSDEELTIIRLFLNIIDFNFLLPSDLKERQNTIKLIIETRF